MEEGFRQISSRVKSLKEEDYHEEDVWAVIEEREGSSLKVKKALQDSSSTSASAYRIPAVPRLIPRVNSCSSESSGVMTHQSSAPVNILDCSKIYKNISNKGSEDDGGHGDGRKKLYYDDGEDGDDDEEIIPPHEFIARRLARSPIVSFSMCEGVGRTLKGRDLSKMRNAILTKTGFLE